MGIGGIQKHTSNKLYWILFPIEDLRQVVETAKRILSALTHIMQIRCDFDVMNSPQYHDDNTLPHIVHFAAKSRTLCKSREAVLQNQGGDCFFYSYANFIY